MVSPEIRNHYDAVGNLIETDQIIGGVTRTTTSTFDVLGRVSSTTDALSHTTWYEYNGSRAGHQGEPKRGRS